MINNVRLEEKEYVSVTAVPSQSESTANISRPLDEKGRYFSDNGKWQCWAVFSDKGR